MAFNIKNEAADELLRELTELTGESLTTAVTESLRERLERERRRRLLDGDNSLDAVIARCRRMCGLTSRAEADAYLYDEHGLPA